MCFDLWSHYSLPFCEQNTVIDQRLMIFWAFFILLFFFAIFSFCAFYSRLCDYQVDYIIILSTPFPAVVYTRKPCQPEKWSSEEILMRHIEYLPFWLILFLGISHDSWIDMTSKYYCLKLMLAPLNTFNHVNAFLLSWGKNVSLVQQLNTLYHCFADYIWIYEIYKMLLFVKYYYI